MQPSKKNSSQDNKKAVTSSMQQMAKVLMEAKKVMNNRAPSFVGSKDLAAGKVSSSNTTEIVATTKTKTSRNSVQQTKESLTGTIIGDVGEENMHINRPSALNFTGNANKTSGM
jgi:hypothetical protein